MEIGDRFYPNKNFEEFSGIKGKKELVSLGCLHFHVRYCKELFSFYEFGDEHFLGRLINKWSIDEKSKWKERAQHIKEISTAEAIAIINKAKSNLKIFRQIVYYERYEGKGMGYYLECFNNSREFKFCGYDIMSSGKVSLITSCGDINIKNVGRLNQYGLFDKIEDAICAQKQIADEVRDSDSTDTYIYGIWRYVNE